MEGDSNKKVMGVLCYLGILWIVPLLTDSKNDPFVKFHINQGIVLTILWIVIGIASSILAFIPIIGGVIGTILWVALAILAILGILNALKLEQKELPVVGKFKVYK